MIKKICPKFLNNLRQPPRDNPWPTHLMNQNYKVQFHSQCDYMFEFQVDKRINESIFLQKWLKNVSNVEDDANETLIFVYNRKLDVLVSTNSIIKSDVEEESSPPYSKDAVTNLEEEMTKMEDSTVAITP